MFCKCAGVYVREKVSESPFTKAERNYKWDVSDEIIVLLQGIVRKPLDVYTGQHWS